MREIQMVDLKTQYERLKPDIDNAIFSVINAIVYKRTGGKAF